jgi:hypothetical protein
VKYAGTRINSGCGSQLVTKDDNILMPGPSQKLYNHSPDGFNWGYGGSGPAQLALALLYDVTGDKELSVRLHQAFKWKFVAGWSASWEITGEEIKQWVETTVGETEEWLKRSPC